MKNEPINMELPGFQAPKRRGRPVTGSAKSSAQRQKEYRDRLRAQGKTRMTEAPAPEPISLDRYAITEKTDLALRRLAHAQGVTPGELVAKLVEAAQSAHLRKVGAAGYGPYHDAVRW